MTSIRRFERTMGLVVLLFLAASFIATGAVLGSSLPPVFNQSQRVYKILNVVLLVGEGAGAAVLAAALATGRFAIPRRAILLVFTTLVVLEALLFVFDTTVFSVSGSPVATAFRNIRAGGEVIYLPQPNPLSPFGFRTPRVEPTASQGYRILFLGNSYVQGSGSRFATNYPQAVEQDLRRRFPDRNITVFSAGVDGFGVKEDRVLYQYLLDQHYKFDLVILNFMMGSDPTNDIPGTNRRAIAGQPQRLHDNWFLRAFYPVNTYIFRYLVYLDVTFNGKWGVMPQVAAGTSACVPSAAFTGFSRERAYDYYGPNAARRLYLDFNIGELQALKALAVSNRTKFLVVLLPDPNALLPANRRYFAKDAMDWLWTRRFMAQRIGADVPLLDLAPSFQDRGDLFKCNDTHWNDAGNLAGAQIVADFVARSAAVPAPPTGQATGSIHASK